MVQTGPRENHREGWWEVKGVNSRDGGLGLWLNGMACEGKRAQCWWVFPLGHLGGQWRQSLERQSLRETTSMKRWRHKFHGDTRSGRPWGCPEGSTCRCVSWSTGRRSQLKNKNPTVILNSDWSSETRWESRTWKGSKRGTPTFKG